MKMKFIAGTTRAYEEKKNPNTTSLISREFILTHKCNKMKLL